MTRVFIFSHIHYVTAFIEISNNNNISSVVVVFSTSLLSVVRVDTEKPHVLYTVFRLGAR